MLLHLPNLPNSETAKLALIGSATMLYFIYSMNMLLPFVCGVFVGAIGSIGCLFVFFTKRILPSLSASLCEAIRQEGSRDKIHEKVSEILEVFSKQNTEAYKYA
ncbi:MAG TPA: hypothetical protein PKD85_15490 [Saprospiraceae bacterium]|nr:hypothetical protein [Saprospiraceae bacterium]